MFSLLRNRVGIPGVIAVVALVLAMTGGAWAASKYIITSTKQIKPSVLSALKGKAGPAGPAGANGTNGANGAPGAPGAPGTSVTNNKLNPGNEHCAEGGAEFKVGSGAATFACTGEPGEAGEPGPEGSPWVAGAAPSGAELRGTWALNSNAAEAEESVFTAVTTGVPLGGTVGPFIRAPGTFGPLECTGTAAAPLPAVNSEEGGAPAKGALCFYTAQATNIDPEFAQPKVTASKGGIVVRLQTLAAGPASAFGSWAMYAP